MSLAPTSSLFGTMRHGLIQSGFCCDWCKTTYPKDDPEVQWAFFGDLHVCSYCFQRVEAAVMEVMPDIITWYSKLLQDQHTKCKAHMQNLAIAAQAVQSIILEVGQRLTEESPPPPLVLTVYKDGTWKIWSQAEAAQEEATSSTWFVTIPMKMVFEQLFTTKLPQGIG